MKRNCRYAKGPLMINALSRILFPPSLLLLSLLSSITMSPAAAAAPLDLPFALPLHSRSNYYEPNTEALPGLGGGAAGYTQHYYGATSALHDDADVVGLAGSDLAAAPYANYEPKAILSASGFVPAGDNYHHQHQHHDIVEQHSRLQSALDRGKIDFVINSANYEQNEQQFPPHPAYTSSLSYPSYGYQPQASVPELAPSTASLFDYPIEQFSNYHPRPTRGGEARQANEENALVYASSMQRSTLAMPQQQQLQQQYQQQQHLSRQLQPRQTQQQQQPVLHEDQQLAERQLHDLPLQTEARSGIEHNAILPPITTTVHHTPASTKALAGLPLSKHIEVTKHVPVTHYQQQHVPYKHTVQLRVPRPVITTIPKPIPIRVPVSKTIAVPQLQEVKIPVEQVKPVAVERRVPYVVERRVPYRVEKTVPLPIYYPYPIKVPIIRTVVHKQRPGKAHWAPSPHNHLLG